MKDIAIIIPIHELADESDRDMLTKAIDNIKACQKFYEHKLNTYIVTPLELDKELTEGCTVLTNHGKTDFCSQVNFGAQNVTEDYFSIMEYDDEYDEKWFRMAKEYFFTNEDVSVFLPVCLSSNPERNRHKINNEAPWAYEFTEEMGYLDFQCLADLRNINLTGGIFNRKDFIHIGGFKSSIQVTFDYEFLLRVTNKKLKVFIVPKNGYTHTMDRKGSLSDINSKKFTEEEIEKWYVLAKKEYLFDEDRGNTIFTNN